MKAQVNFDSLGGGNAQNVFMGNFTHTSTTGKKIPQRYINDSVYCTVSSSDIVIQKSGKYRINVAEYTGDATNYISVNGTNTVLSVGAMTEIEQSLNANDVIYVYRNEAITDFNYSISIDAI